MARQKIMTIIRYHIIRDLVDYFLGTFLIMIQPGNFLNLFNGVGTISLRRFHA